MLDCRESSGFNSPFSSLANNSSIFTYPIGFRFSGDKTGKVSNSRWVATGCDEILKLIEDYDRFISGHVLSFGACR